MVCGLGPHRTPNEGPRYSQMLQTHMRVLFSSMLSMIFTDFMIFIILYHISFFHVLPYSSLKTSTKQGTWSQFMDPYSHPPHHRPHLFHSDKNHRHAASLQGTRLATIKSPRHKWIQMDISTILRDICPMKSTQQICPKMGKTGKPLKWKVPPNHPTLDYLSIETHGFEPPFQEPPICFFLFMWGFQ